MARRQVGEVGVLGEVLGEERFRHYEREVRGDQADAQGERCVGALSCAQELDRPLHGEVVGLDLRRGAGPGLDWLLHRRVGAGLRAEAAAVLRDPRPGAHHPGPRPGRLRDALRPPVHRVDEIRVQIDGELPLEAVQPVRTDEVHLAGQRHLVALRAEQVGPGDRVHRQRRGIVPAAAAVGVAAGHERQPRRHAQRIVAVGGVEGDALARQPVHARRGDEGMAVGAGELRRVLVRHDEQDVGRPGVAIAHGLPPATRMLAQAT